MWRRAFVPANITFSQMALVLEELLEIEKTEMFEFEFYQKGLRLIQWNESWMEFSYRFSYADATENFINELFHDEDWFTFRIISSQIDAPEYRIEIERESQGIIYEGKPLNHPCMIKWKVNPNDRYWSDGNGINSIFSQKYQINYVKKAYVSYGKAINQLEKNKLNVSENPESKKDKYKESAEEALGRLAEEIEIMLGKKQEKSEDEYNVTDMTKSKDDINEIITEAFETTMQETGHKLKKEINDAVNNLPEDNFSMEQILNLYNKEDILNIGDNVGAMLDTSKSKKKLSYDLSRFLLDAANMRQLFYGISTKSLDYFEKVIEENAVYDPTSEDEVKAYTLLSYNYMYEARQNIGKRSAYCVPSDVAVVYQIIKKNGYRQIHEKVCWMISCLGIVNRFYGAITVDLLYKIFKQKKHMPKDYDEFMQVYETVPKRLKLAVIIKDRVIGNQFLEGDLYKQLPNIQRNVDYYIPSVSEIEALERDRYPSDRIEYRQMLDFYVNRMNYDYSQAIYLTIKAFAVISAGGLLSDYMTEIKEDNVEFKSEDEVSEFANIYMRANNITRMLDFKGHCPNEMARLSNNRSNIVPFTPPAQGIPFAYNTKQEPSKKVYPNDPCPCGSGKKYKKCCGRK